MASDIEPAAYLVEWYDAGERSRVQLDKDMEPWLRANEPSVDSLYRSEVVDDLRAEIATLRRQLEEARERNLLANNRADNAEADAAKARASALEEAWLAVAAALGNETKAVQRRARQAIRALSAPQGREG